MQWVPWTVEEFYQDKKKFAKNVFEVASSDLVQMGTTVISHTLKYFKSWLEHFYLQSIKVVNLSNDY